MTTFDDFWNKSLIRKSEHDHQYHMGADSNDRFYVKCSLCPLIYHEWEPDFHHVYEIHGYLAREMRKIMKERKIK